jgi:hypothetical protein
MSGNKPYAHCRQGFHKFFIILSSHSSLLERMFENCDRKFAQCRPENSKPAIPAFANDIEGTHSTFLCVNMVHKCNCISLYFWVCYIPYYCLCSNSQRCIHSLVINSEVPVGARTMASLKISLAFLKSSR